MKRLILLIFGIVIAGTAVYAIPTEIKDTSPDVMKVFIISDEVTAEASASYAITVSADYDVGASIYKTHNFDNPIFRNTSENNHDAGQRYFVRWRLPETKYTGYDSQGVFRGSCMRFARMHLRS